MPVNFKPYLSVIFSLIALPVAAANFSIKKADVQTPYGVSADISMTGPVLDGDKDRLQTVIDTAPWELNRRHLTLRMNSDGGSLAAGIELGEFIHKSGVQTYVGPYDSCLSACAIAFMHGSIHEGDGYMEPARMMHHKGVIGFHAPYAFAKNETVPDSVRDALLPLAERGARQAGSDLVRLSVAGRMPSDLIQELLIVEQEDFLLVNNVDRASRWGIPVEGAKPLRTLHRKRLNAYCTNFFAWENSIAFENRGENSEVSLLSLQDGVSLGTAMMEFDCNLAMKTIPTDDKPFVAERIRGGVKAWQSLPADVLLATLGPEEIEGATGPTWDQRFPIISTTGTIDHKALKDVRGRCKDGLVWTGGWYGKDGSENYSDLVFSHATVAGCGGGLGPMSIQCKAGDPNLLFRFAYNPSQSPNADGLVILDIDGKNYILPGRNGDVHGHEQVYVDLPKGHGVLDGLKGGSLLKMIGDGPNQVVHLSGSGQAIEAMELSCG
jgi:hypothetical protein